MDEFLRALPWRLAAIAGLIIGAISFLAAEVEFWQALKRIAIAFVLFYLVGAAASRSLIAVSPTPPLKKSLDSSRADERGDALQS